MHEALEQLVQQYLDAGNPGVILEVDAPTFGYHEKLSAGQFNLLTGQALDSRDGFRLASMSKTFTATIVMQLMEENVLELDAPVLNYLQIDSIPVAEGHEAEEITLRMLLNHTSGLWDFAMAKDWGREIISNPAKFRAPAETLKWALAYGEPVGYPGEAYHYSDTGYVILGLLVEQLTGSSWGDLCRNRILAPAGLKETWLEGYESPRSTLSHCYTGAYDGLSIHGSVDWAAGGHVSTSSDLQKFMRSLFHGQLFAHLTTLDKALAGADTGDGGRYGAGIRTRTANGTTLWGHLGFWGSFMVYAPAERITITGTLNRTGSNSPELIDAVLKIILG